MATRDVSLSAARTSRSETPRLDSPLDSATSSRVSPGSPRSVIAPNGTTMSNQDFYVRGNAPLGILAVIPIVLLLIAVYEIYRARPLGPLRRARS